MQNKIVMITSQYLHEPTKAALKRLGLTEQILLDQYENFSHLCQVYDRYAAEADGFIVSGRSAALAIEITPHAVQKPVVSLQVDAAALYKVLLQLFLANREQDANRVVLDFLVPLGGGYTVEDYLACEEVTPMMSGIQNWVQQVGIAADGGVEDIILKHLLELWKNGEMDIVLCHYSSLIPALEAAGIPYLYPFSDDHQIQELVDDLQEKIELASLRASLPAIIEAVPAQNIERTEERMQLLQQWFGQYFREQLIGGTVQIHQNRCSTVTTQRTVHRFTDRGTCCGLSAYLKEKLDFPVVVGYGIGSEVGQAYHNAQEALREALHTGHSYIKNESGTMIGPLGSERQIVLETQDIPEIGKIAKQCNLSTMTIQKILASVKISGSKQITTQELASRFGVTVRNANRILTNLTSGGFAHIAYSQTSNSKGRPVKVYELDLDVVM